MRYWQHHHRSIKELDIYNSIKSYMRMSNIQTAKKMNTNEQQTHNKQQWLTTVWNVRCSCTFHQIPLHHGLFIRRRRLEKSTRTAAASNWRGSHFRQSGRSDWRVKELRRWERQSRRRTHGTHRSQLLLLLHRRCRGGITDGRQLQFNKILCNRVRTTSWRVGRLPGGSNVVKFQNTSAN